MSATVTVTLQVSPVYVDRRGNATRPHAVNVRRGCMMQVHRFATPSEADSFRSRVINGSLPARGTHSGRRRVA